MNTFIHRHIYMRVGLDVGGQSALYMYMYTRIYMYICIYVYVLIYCRAFFSLVYFTRERERESKRERERERGRGRGEKEARREKRARALECKRQQASMALEDKEPKKTGGEKKQRRTAFC
jgi:hypothetical protein